MPYFFRGNSVVLQTLQDQADPIDFSSASILQPHSKKLFFSFNTFNHFRSSHVQFFFLSGLCLQAAFLTHSSKTVVLCHVAFMVPLLLYVLLMLCNVGSVSCVHAVHLSPFIHQSFISAVSSLWTSPAGFSCVPTQLCASFRLIIDWTYQWILAQRKRVGNWGLCCNKVIKMKARGRGRERKNMTIGWESQQGGFVTWLTVLGSGNKRQRRHVIKDRIRPDHVHVHRRL